MDLSDESDANLKCYKCNDHLYGSLNIIQKDSDKTFIFWNKYQIFLYEDLNFEEAAKEFTPEFQISQLLVSNNYLTCIDCNGNVHTTSLKFKNSRQKNYDISFQAREQCVLQCTLYSPESALVLKHQSGDYFLCLHRMSTDFDLEKEMSVKVEEKHCLRDNKSYLLTCRAISKEEFSTLSKYFQEITWRNYSLVLVSFDKLSVYACLFSPKSLDDVIPLKKLYTSPSQICDVKIVDHQELQVIIALTCGTIVRLKLNNENDTPEIIHLNSAVSKFMAFKDSIMYSDGQTMWEAENIHSKESINFKQFFVRDVKDFVKYGDQIICTTFSNLIYSFSTENKSAFVIQNDDLYCPVEKLVNNSDYLVRINEEIEKNKEIINNINNEGNYLTAVSLSRRQDIMDNVIDENVTVYESYEEVIQQNSEITLTEELQEYFKTDSIILLVKISAIPVQHCLSNILNDIFENLKIHVTLSTEGKNIKTTTVKLTEPLKKIQIVIPVERDDVKEMNIEIKLITEIPGALNRKETIWTVLHRKVIELHAEHFIRTNSSTNKIKNLKQPKESMDEMIWKTAEEQHGHLFKITDSSKNKYNKSPSFYVKLPHNYSDILKDENTFRNHFSTQKASYIQKHLTTEEFLKSKIYAAFEICKEKVYLEILNDEFSNPLLKISCTDMKIAFDIRNFFAKVFHEDVKSSGAEFISNALYTTTENIQKSLKQCSNLEDCLQLADRLQKNVIANLPL